MCFQVTPVTSVIINQQNNTPLHTQAISLDLKANGTPTLVTDSNGNHYLIALTSHTADRPNGTSSLTKINGRITLQVHNVLLNYSHHVAKFAYKQFNLTFSEITVNTQ